MNIVISKRKLLISLLLVAIFVCSFVLCGTTNAYQVFYGGTLKKLPIYSVDTTEKKIAISFDCAWGDTYTNGLLNVMKEKNVRCTFFCVEFWTEKYPEHIKEISESGHEIGTHSATHPKMSTLSKENIIKELSSSKLAIENITGKNVTLFRAPFGDYNDNLLDIATELGLYTIQWNIDSLDWKNISANEIIKRVVSNAQNGSIVLFHNQGLHTLEALPTIIDNLQEKGFSFVPIGELIYKENYKIDITGKQISTLS